MRDSELRKLNRQDLLKLLLESEKENRRLSGALEEARAQLRDRQLLLSETGNLAEAALALNGVFEAAQSAADEYLAQVTALCEKRDEESRRQALERLDRSRRMLEETEERCREMEAAARVLFERSARDGTVASEEEWSDVYARMQEYLKQHPGLKSGRGGA